MPMRAYRNDLEAQQKAFTSSPNVLYSYIVSPDQKIVMGTEGIDSPDIGKPKQSFEPPLINAASHETEVSFLPNSELLQKYPDKLSETSRIKLVSIPLNCSENTTQCAFLKVAFFPESHLVFLSKITTFLIAICLFIVFLCGVLTYYFSHKILRPISKISNALSGASQGHQVELKPLMDLAPDAAQEVVDLQNALATFTAMLKKSSLDAAIVSTTQSMAHDVRKPFSLVRMVLESLQASVDLAEIREVVDLALPDVRQAMASVESMLQDIMHMGSNTAIEKAALSPHDLMLFSLRDIFRIFPERDVQLNFKLNLVHKVSANAHHLGRVFSNILGNALQAMGSEGVLWMRTKETTDMVEFYLGNSHSVVQMEVLSKLFDAFYTSGKPGGTGLGLAIVQKVISEHGGNIRCESAINTTYPQGYVEFIFSLPKTNEADIFDPGLVPDRSSQVISKKFGF